MRLLLVISALVFCSCSILSGNPPGDTARKPASARRIDCEVSGLEAGRLRVSGILESNYLIRDAAVWLGSNLVSRTEESRASIYKRPGFTGSRFFLGRDHRTGTGHSIVLPMSLEHKEKVNVIYILDSGGVESDSGVFWGGCYLE